VGYWDGKVALVTGGSAGLGLAIAEALVRQGARVAIAARDERRLQSAVAALQASGGRKFPGAESPGSQFLLSIPADVTRQDDVERMIAETVRTFGRLDLLVNNAGQSMRGEVLATPPEDFARLFEINFLSIVRCTQVAAKHLIESRGHIVNVGSLASKTTSRYLGAYPASKFPVAAFSQQLRLELEPQGVHTLLVCPGPIRRDDAGQRYADQAVDLPPGARQPGGGAKLKGIDPTHLAAMILRACERRRAELIVPWWARFPLALAQIWPRVGDWIVKRLTKS